MLQVEAAADTAHSTPSVNTPLVRSVAYAPFAPRGEHQQQPSSAAAPFIPGGSFKANAAPFIPGSRGGDSGSAELSAIPSTRNDVGGIVLPSDDDFTLGLTDLSISAAAPVHGGGAARPPPGPPPPHAGHVGAGSGGGGSWHPSSLPSAIGGSLLSSGQIRHAALHTRPPLVAPGRTLASSRFASDQLHAELRQQAFLEHAQVDPANEDTADLPLVRTRPL